MDATGVIAADAPPVGARLGDGERDALVLEVVRAHADELLRFARRFSVCGDDAQDAYQRALEIMLRHAHRLDAERAPSWLRTVVKHEALAIRRARQRDMAPAEIDFDALEARTTPSPEERATSFEAVSRSAEALHRLKPQEVRALWLRAQGNTYEEIGELTGWTRTKVNRCLYEGRRSFLERYAGIESGAECERWQPLLSSLVDGEATRDQLVELRPHLRACPSCRAVVRELHRASAPLGALLPGIPLAVAEQHAEPAGHLFVKVYDTATTWLGERAASSLVRAQLTVDALSASAGKLTAVAAASAAVAGGGVVAVERAGRDAPARPPAAVPLSRASSPIDAGGTQRRLTIDEQVERRLRVERRRLERRAAAQRVRDARRAAASAAASPVRRAGSARPAAAAVTRAAPAGRGQAGTAPAPGAELGLE